MSNSRIAWLVGFLLLAILIRVAMEWHPEWSLILLLPFGYLLARDIRRWRGNSSKYSLVRSVLRLLVRWRLQISFLLQRGLVHRGPSEPKGYCPKCGYPINPGICTECGMLVTKGKLRRSAPSRIWQHRGKVVATVAIIALIYAGKYLHQNYDWTQARSNETLFDLMSIRNDPAIRELEDRHRGGKLNKAESARLFDRSLSSKLVLMPTFPSDANLSFMLHVDLSLPTICMEHHFFLGDYRVYCDGEVLYDSVKDSRRRSQRDFMGRWHIIASHVRPGSHEISLKGTVVISNGVDSVQLIDLLAVHHAPIVATGTVEAVSRPSIEFLERITDPKTVAQYARDTYIELTYSIPSRSTGFNYNMTPEKVIRLGRSSTIYPFIGRVEIRRSGEPDSAYQFLGRVSTTGFNWTDYPFSRVESLADADRLDVRFIPEPTRIVQHLPLGISSYCDVALEQTELSWPKGDPRNDWHMARRSDDGVMPRVIPMPEQ